jgi:hypothetical protein
VEDLGANELAEGIARLAVSQTLEEAGVAVAVAGAREIGIAQATGVMDETLAEAAV